jgi:hypothetical protein
MAQLRDRMAEDLKLTGYASSTHRIYLHYAKNFAKCVFRRSWTGNPEEAGQRFRRKVDTDSEGSWTAIPKEGGHQVRRNLMRLSHDTGRRVSSIKLKLPWST